MNILFVGQTGIVGSKFVDRFHNSHNLFLVSSSKSNFKNNLGYDLSDLNRCYDLKKNLPKSIDYVINFAGNKNIEDCEINPKKCYQSNFFLVKNLITVFNKSCLIHLSTDYVFDGLQGNYTINSIPNPSTVYGKSKFEAENYIKLHCKNYTIVRASAIYHNNSSFIKFIISRIENSKFVEAYEDVLFSPTYLNDLISSIDSVLKNGCDNSVIHVCDNIISRYDFACKVSIQLVGNHDLIRKTKNPNKSVFFPNLSLIDSGFINKLTTSKNLSIEFN